jgi:hypothetical protein
MNPRNRKQLLVQKVSTAKHSSGLLQIFTQRILDLEVNYMKKWATI